jgi:DNA-binding CsgD family transcriptional regulator
MPRKKWITKKEVADILKSYSVRPNEFEQVGDDGYFFKSSYTKGYTISFEPEIQNRSVKTGRIIVSHTRNGGKRTFQDLWERDPDGRLQFVFRNPWDRPLTDYDYIQELEAQVLELKETGQKLQEQLTERHEPLNDTKPSQESLEQLQQEIAILESENKALQTQVATLTEKYEGLLEKSKHNARGAGRKADLAHLESQAKKVQDLLDAGKTPVEVQKIMGISRSSFFKYKKHLQTNGC